MTNHKKLIVAIMFFFVATIINIPLQAGSEGDKCATYCDNTTGCGGGASCSSSKICSCTNSGCDQWGNNCVCAGGTCGST